MKICLDTSAWLEYLNDGPFGPEVRRLLEENQLSFTPAVVAAQVIEAARLRDENSKTFLEFVESQTEIVPVTAEIARLAGKINAQRAHPPNDWTLIESLILATCQQIDARLVTRDALFGAERNVLFLGEDQAASDDA